MSDPTDPDLAIPPRAPPRRRGLGVMFWLVMLFGLACIVAGFAIARYGPTLFPVEAPAPAAPAAPAAAVITPLALAQPAPAAAAEAPADLAPTSSSVQLNALAERVDRVEGGQQRLSRAAASALAAASLTDAADSSRPFGEELTALAPVLPSSSDVQALAAYARTGAPTVAGLAQAWPDVAARAALAARARTEGGGVIDRIAQALASVMTIRRIDRLEGKDADAVLARASGRIDDGDLDGALAELEALPPAAREATAAWRARAQRRLEIDRRVGAIRAAALNELSRTSGERPQA
jgi:hypothetical protein